jgi:acetyl esterase/lipase
MMLIAATGWLVRAEVRRPETPEGVRVFAGIVYREADGHRLRLDVYVPDAPQVPGGSPAVVAIHGGGWRGGSRTDYGRSLTPLVRAGLVVVAVDYRLSRPGAPSWPENLDDVREAVRWVRQHADDYGIDPDRIAAMGASAGAHLALLLGSASDIDIPRGPGDPSRVGAVIDFFGPTDLKALHDTQLGAKTAIELLLGGSPSKLPRRSDSASPLRYVAPGNPPVLIVHGSDDLLVPIGQSRALADALERADVPHRLVVVEGARHGFGIDAGPRSLVPDLLAFLESAWKVKAKRI